jgi:hypothetical protein
MTKHLSKGAPGLVLGEVAEILQEGTAGPSHTGTTIAKTSLEGCTDL